MAKKDKKPHLAHQPLVAKKVPAIAGVGAKGGGKQPFAGAPGIDESNQCLAWRLSMIDTDGSWSWHDAEGDHLIDAREKLGELEKFTWAQLDRKLHHSVPVADLETPAQKRLRELKQDDV